MSVFNELKNALEEAIDIKENQKSARVTRYEISDVKAIRAQLSVSQQAFAQALGTSFDTVKSWEKWEKGTLPFNFFSFCQTSEEP